MNEPVMDLMRRYRFKELLLLDDADTGLQAVIAIYSTALGPSGGGVRFWPCPSEKEPMVDAMRLARGMTYKYAAVGRDLGGGKAVIIGDPRKDKSEALLRELTWKRAFASAKSLRQIFPLSVSPSDIIRLLGSVGL